MFLCLAFDAVFCDDLADFGVCCAEGMFARGWPNACLASDLVVRLITCECRAREAEAVKVNGAVNRRSIGDRSRLARYAAKIVLCGLKDIVAENAVTLSRAPCTTRAYEGLEMKGLGKLAFVVAAEIAKCEMKEGRQTSVFSSSRPLSFPVEALFLNLFGMRQSGKTIFWCRA